MQVTRFTENWYVCLLFFASKCRELLVTFAKLFDGGSTEWFQQLQEFSNEIENMEVAELKNCLAKFCVSVRKTDGQGIIRKPACCRSERE